MSGFTLDQLNELARKRASPVQEQSGGFTLDGLNELAKKRLQQKNDELGEFVETTQGLPSAKIDIPAEREKNAARAAKRKRNAEIAAEQNRQARIAEMNMLIAQNEKDNAARKAANRQSYLDELAAKRAAQEQSVQKKTVRRPQGRDLLQEELDGMEKMVVDTTGGGVHVVDGKGNRRAYTDADRVSKREVNAMINYDPDKGYSGS